MLVIISGYVFNYGTSGTKIQDHPFFVICVMTTRSENCHFQKYAKLWQKYSYFILLELDMEFFIFFFGY